MPERHRTHLTHGWLRLVVGFLFLFPRSIMDITNPAYIIFDITSGNVQYIAQEILGRELTGKELETVEHYLDDYIDAGQGIEYSIREICGLKLDDE